MNRQYDRKITALPIGFKTRRFRAVVLHRLHDSGDTSIASHDKLKFLEEIADAAVPVSFGYQVKTLEVGVGDRTVGTGNAQNLHLFGCQSDGDRLCDVVCLMIDCFGKRLLDCLVRDAPGMKSLRLAVNFYYLHFSI